MFRKNFTIAWRNLRRNRSFAIINILGLAVGMATAILIMLDVHYVARADNFYPKIDRLYEVFSNDKLNGTIRTLNRTPELLAADLKHNYPGIEAATRVGWTRNLVTPIDPAASTPTTDQTTPTPTSPANTPTNPHGFMTIGFSVDHDFLDMFNLPLAAGDPRTALDDRHSMIVTHDLAQRLFHTDDVIGRTVRLGDSTLLKVTGVLKETRDHSFFMHPMTYLVSYDLNYVDSNWTNISIPTFVLLRQNASAATVGNEIKDIIPTHSNNRRKTTEFLYPVSRLSLHGQFVNGKETGGFVLMARTFTLIAIFIILIACINFINLSTAYSQRRAKEVGIRKVIGAVKSSLLLQFLGESLLMAAVAGAFALLLVQIALPVYDNFTECPMYIDYQSPVFWASYLGFILFIGALAGSYPAIVLSSFKPVSVLKGRMANLLSTILARKILVVFQFSIAIVLIICTLIVTRQLEYGRTREAGYDRDRLVDVKIINDNLLEHYDAFRDELLASGAATAVTETYSGMTDIDSWTINLKFAGSEKLPPTQVSRNYESGGLVATAGMHLVMGRDIDLQHYPTDVNACMINEAAMAVMQFKDPIGQQIRDGQNIFNVVGVVSNYIQESPYRRVQPTIIEGKQPYQWMGSILVRFNGRHPMNQNIATTEKIVRKFVASYPFEYSFVDEDYAHKFKIEQTTGTLAAIFTALIIFVSCLGLFGLAAYNAQARVKEIGIRKVLGASIANISLLLSRDFIRLVAIAIVVAIPISIAAMNSWLDNYDYHITITWDIFALAGLAALLVALATVSSQTIKAAAANPIKNLRINE
jgi:putative ABC transport system permease protein